MDNKIIKTELIEWKLLKPFQPSDLKKMSKIQLDKLKTSLKSNGFKTAFNVWQEKDNIWCLDGHHRLLVMKLLEDEGESIPERLPANFIDCKTKKDAKKALLIFNSHYADIEHNILKDFISDLDSEILSEINFEGLELSIEEDNPEIKKAELKPYKKYHILISYDNSHLSSINKIIEQVNKIIGIEIEQSSN